ncbi:MAG: Clp protease ClpP [Bacteroidia bacterium]|nr:Clp protease ClpP [Bacteroidia bacterium]
MEYKIINATTAELKFYGYIDTWYNGADDYTRTLEALLKQGITDVNVMVHCYGGNVFEGAAIWTANKTSKLRIHFKVVGIAASMMAVILLSGTSVEVSSMAKVMFHAPRSSNGGTSKQLFQEANLLKKMEKDFINAWKQATGQSDKEAQQLMDGTDYWYDADECVKFGIAKSIIPETAFVTDLQGKPDTGTPIDKVFGTYTAAFLDKTQKMDNNAIISRFDLQNVTAQSNDASILDALAAQLTAKDKRISALEKSNEEAQTATIDALIANKEKALGLTFEANQKEQFRVVGKASTEALQTVLEAMKPSPNFKDFITGENKSTPGILPTTLLPKSIDASRKDWTLKDWADKDVKGLESISNSEDVEIKAYFNKLYKAEYSD